MIFGVQHPQEILMSDDYRFANHTVHTACIYLGLYQVAAEMF